MHLFPKNIDRPGRLVRGAGALGLFAGAWFGFAMHWVLGLGLLMAGAFVMFEALRGWCVLRACGLRTPF